MSTCFIKILILQFYLIFFITPTFAQYRLTLEVGTGSPTLTNGPYSGVTYAASTSSSTVIGLGYLRKVFGNLYLGAKLYKAGYILNYSDLYNNAIGNYGGAITLSSTYLFFAPTVDYVIDKWQILHFFVSGAYGTLYNWNQTTEISQYHINNVINSYNSNSEIGRHLLRLDIGFTEHIRWSTYWHITLNESYSFLQSRLTSLDNPNGNINVSPSYWMFTLGVMHKYGSNHYPERDED